MHSFFINLSIHHNHSTTNFLWNWQSYFSYAAQRCTSVVCCEPSALLKNLGVPCQQQRDQHFCKGIVWMSDKCAMPWCSMNVQFHIPIFTLRYFPLVYHKHKTNLTELSIKRASPRKQFHFQHTTFWSV